MNKLDSLLQHLIVFIIFGSIYYMLEIIYDGTSHWAMFVCAGLSGNLANYLHTCHPRMMILKKIFFITSIILVLEYTSGYILNVYFKLNVWDYSEASFNLHGQICLLFAFIWFFIFSPMIIWFVGGVRYVLFGERRPSHLLNIYGLFFTDLLGIIGMKTLRTNSLTFQYKKRV